MYQRRSVERMINDLVPGRMTVTLGENVITRFDMALFGMVWLLRVRSEMRRCAKCRRDELLAAQQEQQNEIQDSGLALNQSAAATAAAAVVHQTSETLNASATTLFTLDTPGASGPAGSYCEVHGYIPPKEGIN